MRVRPVSSINLCCGVHGGILTSSGQLASSLNRYHWCSALRAPPLHVAPYVRPAIPVTVIALPVLSNEIPMRAIKAGISIPLSLAVRLTATGFVARHAFTCVARYRLRSKEWLKKNLLN